MNLSTFTYLQIEWPEASQNIEIDVADRIVIAFSPKMRRAIKLR